MTDQFAVTVHNLLNATRGLSDKVLDESQGRVIRRLADWVAIQRDNPFKDFTLPQLLAIDFADATLAWLDDPTSRPEIAQFKNTRLALLQSLQDDDNGS